MGFFDFLNPPASQVQAPPGWSMPPSGMNEIANKALGGIGNLGHYNQYAQNMGQFNQTGQDLMNNPYAQQWLQGAGQAGGMGQQAAGNMFNQGGNLYGGANSIMNTAFDPQNALYDRTFAQNQQQNRASQAARGVLSSPYGAGLENQANNNFNMDWQNQQLQRQIAGGGAASQMSGMGANLQGAAPGLYNQSSAMPYNAYNQIGQNQLGVLGQMGQFGQNAGNQANQQNQAWMQMLGIGNQANQNQNQNFANQLKQSQLAGEQQNQMFSGLGNLLGMGMQFGSPLSGLGTWATNQFSPMYNAD